MKKKILFLVSHRKDRAPNQRFRFEQYIPILEQNGFKCDISPLITTVEEDRLFYSSGNYVWKMPLGVKLGWRRLIDLTRANNYDIIFIAREAFIIGIPFFEKLFSLSKAKIIFDFDDSIWMNVVSTNNQLFSWLKGGSKTSKIISYADRIFAGNEYLASYARRFSNDTVIIPTTIDTNIYKSKYNINKEKITIGWSGSVSTIEHFQFVVPALIQLRKKFKSKIEIKVIGDGQYKNEDLETQGIPWRLETELQDLHEIDIGIMPLPNDEWTWGKCGLKGLQYMALEIPTIMSPVGVNIEIINDGENGFLASDIHEWVKKISDLVMNPSLRTKIGQAGRKTVIEKYSVTSQQKNYLNQFISLSS